jgi:hypothetical protein
MVIHGSGNTRHSICSDCGSASEAGRGREFAFGYDGVLCWGCALRRGGRYDARRDSWTRPPRVDDLLPRHERQRS